MFILSCSRQQGLYCNWNSRSLLFCARSTTVEKLTKFIFDSENSIFRPQLTCSRTTMASKLRRKETKVVVSGISVRFPESNNLDEFRDNLFNKVDMVTEDDRRWPVGLWNLPGRRGKLKDLTAFDAELFGIEKADADFMDPGTRLMLECTFEAILDAGLQPSDLKGSRTGIFMGLAFDEIDMALAPEHGEAVKFRQKFARQVSYVFDFRGPCTFYDTACSSSFAAMTEAIHYLRNGELDYALVAGCNVALSPSRALLFQRLNMLSKAGKCNFLDADGAGYVKSEAVAIALLQRKPEAKRVYTEIVHAKSNTDGYKEDGFTFPKWSQQYQVMKETYEEAGVHPNDIQYLEAHGTGTPAGDTQETQAISRMFCEGTGRSGPLLVGSVKTNMGHGEAASGLCSLAKLIIAYENKMIPPIIHLKTPNPKIPSLIAGKIKPVLENTPFEGGYLGCNNVGMGGSNCCTILLNNDKEVSEESFDLFAGVDGVQKLPRLVLCCGRTEFAANHLTASIKKMRDESKLTVDFLDLVNNFSKLPSSSLMNHRSGLLISEESVTELKAIQISQQRRPLWFVFPGLGSQWTQMGKSLMAINSFAKSVGQSAQLIDDHLLRYEVNLVSLLTEDSKVDVETSPLAGVALAAFQIALLDVLKELGLEPDGYIGHSVGELGCAYADGCLTKEQMLLAPLCLHRTVAEEKLAPGLMAAVGLSAKETQARCPKNVYVACDNGEDLVTISGSYEETKEFVAHLEADSVFVKEVKSCGIAFHCPYMDSLEEKLLSGLTAFMDPEPKLRSPKWVSTSLPREKWSSEFSKSMTYYFLDNLVSPVLFREACKEIPEDAVVIEISPQSFFASILKRNLTAEQTIIPLLKRNHNPGNLDMMLHGLGLLYQASCPLDIAKLYRKVEYPLARGTPSLAPLIKLDHTKPVLARLYPNFYNMESVSESTVTVDINSKEWDFVTGHFIDGRVLFPATGYLYLALKALAKIHGCSMQTLPAEFNDVKFLRATIMNAETPTKFHVTLVQGKVTGSYSLTITESGALVSTGNIRLITRQSKSQDRSLEDFKLNGHLTVTHTDVYRELRIRGYEYGKSFRHIEEAYSDGSRFSITWTGNWIKYVDNALQIAAVTAPMRGLYLPVCIRSIKCYPQELFAKEVASQLEVSYDKMTNSFIGTGFEIRGLEMKVAPIKAKHEQDAVEEYKFVPLHEKNDSFSSEQLRRPLIDIAIENTNDNNFVVVELTDTLDFHKGVFNVLTTYQARNFAYKLLTPPGLEEGDIPNGIQVVDNTSAIADANLLVVKICSFSNINGPLVQKLSTQKDGNFLLLESSEQDDDLRNVCPEIRSFYVIVSVRRSLDATCALWKKMRNDSRVLKYRIVEVEVEISSGDWIKKVQRVKADNYEGTTWLRSNCPGLIGLFNCLKREPDTEQMRLIITADEKPKNGNLDMNKVYARDLKVNVLKGGQWGTLRHLAVDTELEAPTEHAYLNIKTIGDLTSFRWYESSFNRAMSDSQKKNLVHVHYSALNFKDIMLASGKLSMDSCPKEMTDRSCVIGLEFSGISSSGKRVAGILGSKGLATSVLAEDPEFTWTVPDKWTFEDAATVPVVYATAYYALIMRGQLIRGETVLIHSGSGGVGQAAISICLSMGCTVFTTTGSKEKREYLKSAFPQLTDRNISSSRDLTFEKQIMRETGGRGVDIVLNSLSEEKLQASVRCLADNGRFLEIGKFDLSLDNKLEASLLAENKTFHGIFLDSLFNFGSGPDSVPLAVKLLKLRLHKIVSEGIASGTVRPLRRTVFSINQIEEAFRFMASGQHIGKVLIRIGAEGSQLTANINAIRQTWFDETKSYVIAGGLGGFGLEVARWMAERGARKLVMTSRSGATTSNQLWTLKCLKERGVHVEVLKLDVASKSDVTKMLQKASSLGPVGGVFNLALVLSDALLEKQTVQTFDEPCRPKILGTQNLDVHTRQACKELDYFVTFSSVCCGKGNAGQSNYGYANSVMEGICEQRRVDGLHGLAIQWGAVGDVGFLAKDMAATEKEVVIRGTRPQRIASCIHFLEKMLQLQTPVVMCSSPVPPLKAIKLSGGVDENLVDKIAHVMGIDDKSILSPDSKKTLSQLGIDSLMSEEVKQILSRISGKSFTTQEVRMLTVAELHTLK